jgi:formylglycine-generating enzyme required for sulfatase activity
MWQATTPGDYMTWEDAKAYCDNLKLAGYDDWRLPTISELRTLIRGCDATVTGGSCGVTDECLSYDDCWNDPCAGCDSLAGPGPGGAYWPDGITGEITWYWASSRLADIDYGAWGVDFGGGVGGGYHVDYSDRNFARCVR